MCGVFKMQFKDKKKIHIDNEERRAAQWSYIRHLCCVAFVVVVVVFSIIENHHHLIEI